LSAQDLPALNPLWSSPIWSFTSSSNLFLRIFVYSLLNALLILKPL
jgi:hypothetical protein